MTDAFISSFVPPAEKPDRAYWFLLSGRTMLVTCEDGKAPIPSMGHPYEVGLEPLSEHYLGTFRGLPCYAAEIEEAQPVPQGMVRQGLWGLFDYLDIDLFRVALRAVHILHWDRSDRFCGRCGQATAMKERERAKFCPSCGQLSFPRISPAVIVLVSRGREILLARSPRFKEETFSILAGFVEPGETLEETVKREIREEVGIEVDNIRYVGSQHWPFPDSLMIGFTAEYSSGELTIDKDEIVAAGWFDVDNLPMIPGKISIARQMIDGFLETLS
jgi:NAD+ diphosphatase